MKKYKTFYNSRDFINYINTKSKKNEIIILDEYPLLKVQNNESEESEEFKSIKYYLNKLQNDINKF